MTRSWNSMLALCSQSGRSWHPELLLVSSGAAPMGQPQSLCASWHRVWSCLVSLAWLGQWPARARWSQGRTFQSVPAGHRDTLLVPRLCPGCPGGIANTSCGAPTAPLCSHLCLPWPSHVCKVERQQGQACWALSTARVPRLSTCSQPGKRLKCQPAANCEGVGEFVLNCDVAALRRVCLCMNSPDLLTPPLSHEPTPGVLGVLILSPCTALGICFHLTLLSLLFISLVLGTMLISLNRKNNFQCHLKC